MSSGGREMRKGRAAASQRPALLGRVLVAFLALAPASCSEVLGGLAPGSARDGGAPPPPARAEEAPAASDGAPAPAQPVDACSWPGAWRYRVPLTVESAAPAVAGYQAKIVLPTAALVAAGKLRADGADLRVAADDGATIVPHWVERGVGTDRTVIWARVDLKPPTTRAWLYYGDPSATDVASLDRTFVRGALADPRFEHDGWERRDATLEGPISRTNEWLIETKNGEARFRIVRANGNNGAGCSLCQTLFLPAGSSHVLAFDAAYALQDHGALYVGWAATDARAVPWEEELTAAAAPSIETYPMPPGRVAICVGAFVGASPQQGQGVDVTVSRPRVRRHVESAKAPVVGPEEARPCP